MTEPYDVIVVGAGPAGAMAGYAAARIGARTLILEKDTLPRFKLCGGGVNDWVMRHLPIPPEVIERTMTHSCTIVGRRLLPPFPLTERWRWHIVRREVFDAHLVGLARAAGAEVREGAKALEVLKEHQRVVGVRLADGEELRAPVTICAEGVHGAVTRSAGFWEQWWEDAGRGHRQQSILCVGMRMRLAPEVIEERFGDTFYYHFETGKTGYFWMFPARDHVNLGMGYLEADSRTLPRVFLDHIRRHPLVSRMLEGGVPGPVRGAWIPWGKGPLRPTYADGVLVVGDACGMVGAVAGEGIVYAVRAGLAAGETVVEAMRAEDASAATLRRYEERWMDEIGGDLLDQVRIVRQASSALRAMRMFTERSGVTLARHFIPFPA